MDAGAVTEQIRTIPKNLETADGEGGATPADVRVGLMLADQHLPAYL